MSKDFNRIRENLNMLLDQNASNEEIQEYIGFEGVTLHDVMNDVPPVDPALAQAQRIAVSRGQDPSNIQRLELPEPTGSRTALETERRELRRTDLSSQFGAPVDLDKDLTDIGTRFDLARSDNPEERLLKLQETRPDLEVVMSGDKEIFFRKKGTEDAFSPIDADAVTAADLFGDIGGSVANLPTALSLAAIPFTGGQSVPARIGIEALLAGAGSVADTGIEEARGVQRDPIEDELKKAAIEGVFGAGGEAVGSTITGAKNLFTGRRPVGGSGDALEAQQFAREEGLRGLTVGQVSDDPLFKVIEGQSQKISPVVGRERVKQSEQAIPFLRKVVKEGNVDSLSDRSLGRFVNVARNKIITQIDNPKISARLGGESLQEGIETFKTASRANIGRLYDAARKASKGTGGFDISNVKSLADEISVGTPGVGTKKGVETGLVDEAGEAITRDKKVNIDLEGAMPAELKSVISDIKALDPNIRVNTTSRGDIDPFEQIKALRTRLFDLKTPPVGETANNANRQAGRLYNELTNAMNNPVGGSEEFLRVSKQAAKANADLESVIEKNSIQQILKSGKVENAAQLVTRFATPGNSEALSTLKKTLPKKNFETFRDGFKTSLLSEPDKILSRIDDFVKNDPEALGTLLTKGEQSSFRTMGKALKRLETNAAVKLAEKEADLAARGTKIFNGASRAEMLQFINEGGKRAAKRRKEAIAGSLIGEVIRKAERTVRGKDLSASKAIVEGIKNLEKNPNLQLVLSPEQIKRLKKFKVYESFIGDDLDVGSSFIAASLGSAFTDISGGPTAYGTRILAALMDRFGDNRIGELMINPKVTGYLVGKGKPKSTGDVIRSVSVMLSLGIPDIQDGTARPESEEGK